MIEDVYQTDLLKLAARARGAGRLDHADVSAMVDNPLCGDRITVDLALDGERVAALGYEVRACVLCQASASVLGAHAAGHGTAELDALGEAIERMLKEGGEAPAGDFAEYTAFEPVRRAKSRHECVLLPFRAIRQALAGPDAAG